LHRATERKRQNVFSTLPWSVPNKYQTKVGIALLPSLATTDGKTHATTSFGEIRLTLFCW